MTTQPISPADLASLSERDRSFYIEHRDDLEMTVHNGKLHFIVENNQPTVAWPRFYELVQLADSLIGTEAPPVHAYHDLGNWNPFGRPYLDHGLHYSLNFDVSEYSLQKLGITQNAKEWLIDWLLAHGFTPEQAVTVKYTGGISGYTKAEGYYSYKSYGFEVRCNFTDIPPHYLPEKVHKWAKRNPQYKHLIFA